MQIIYLHFIDVFSLHVTPTLLELQFSVVVLEPPRYTQPYVTLFTFCLYTAAVLLILVITHCAIHSGGWNCRPVFFLSLSSKRSTLKGTPHMLGACLPAAAGCQSVTVENGEVGQMFLRHVNFPPQLHYVCLSFRIIAVKSP